MVELSTNSSIYDHIIKIEKTIRIINFVIIVIKLNDITTRRQGGILAECHRFLNTLLHIHTQ